MPEVIVDYYEELSISSSLSVPELNSELSRLETVWKRREITNPEKATKMIVLISDARKVFQNDTSKREYDKRLAESKKPHQDKKVVNQRSESFARWHEDALNYYRNGQYDLARTAIDRAFQFFSDSSDGDFYDLAANIYEQNGQYDTALSYINNAIVVDNQNGKYYLTKSIILADKRDQAAENRRFDEKANFASQMRNTALEALSKASMRGDDETWARVCGVLAISFYSDKPIDFQKAEEYAQTGVQKGDSWGNSRKVLDIINRDKENARRIEDERVRREAEEKRQKEEYERNVAENNRKAQKRDEIKNEAKKKEKILTGLGWAFVVVSIVLLFVPVTFVIKQLCALIGMALIGYTNTYGEFGSNNLFGDFWYFILGGGFVYGLISCTGAYKSMGYGATQAYHTQLIFLIFLAAVVIVTFVSPIIGRHDYKKVKKKIDSI